MLCMCIPVDSDGSKVDVVDVTMAMDSSTTTGNILNSIEGVNVVCNARLLVLSSNSIS